jgi:hypothetical protein
MNLKEDLRPKIFIKFLEKILKIFQDYLINILIYLFLNKIYLFMNL